MASQKTWDKTEAAILLEALIRVKEGEVSRKDAIKSVSERLREKAQYGICVCWQDINKTCNKTLF